MSTDDQFIATIGLNDTGDSYGKVVGPAVEFVFAFTLPPFVFVSVSMFSALSFDAWSRSYACEDRSK